MSGFGGLGFKFVWCGASRSGVHSCRVVGQGLFCFFCEFVLRGVLLSYMAQRLRKRLAQDVLGFGA